MVFSIDHHFVNSVNLAGLLLSILGFFYLTYALFGRKPLKWFIRIVTPCLVGVSILAAVGILEYVYLIGNVKLELRNGVLYGLLGGMIGIFNGIFVSWPLALKKPPIFSWKDCLIGLAIMFGVCFIVGLLFELTPIRGLSEASILSPIGGVAGGLWHFLNWSPTMPNKKAPAFSWKGCLIGLICAFLLGILVSIALGRSLSLSFVAACTLVPTGGIIGGLRHFFYKEMLLDNKVFLPLDQKSDSVSENSFKKRWTKSNLLLPSSLISNSSLKELSSNIQLHMAPKGNPFLTFENLSDMEFTEAGILVPQGRYISVSLPRPPIFSARGCLIGLVSAFLFGFFLALAVDIAFGSILFVGSLRAALTAASLMGPAGALTGGISRFIFWRADCLTDDQLGGIGAALTLLGFILQLLPPIIDILNIPVR